MSFNPFHHTSAKALFIFLVLLAVSTCSQADTADQIPQSAAPDEDTFIRVSVYRLSIDPASQQPVVTLADPDEQRVFPIWIGLSEARAIHLELQGSKNFRPLTHDLLAGIIGKVDGNVHRVMITHIKDNVFYATLVIKKDSDLIEVDARPSDSIVLALKFNAPIYVGRTLFKVMSVPVDGPREASPQNIGEDYGLNIQEITPALAQYRSLKLGQGVMVSAVHPGSRAAQDGIQAGDILFEIDGLAIQDVATAKRLMEQSAGDLKAKFIRERQTLTLTLQIR
jgi:bifunctional DNase/RNase